MRLRSSLGRRRHSSCSSVTNRQRGTRVTYKHDAAGDSANDKSGNLQERRSHEKTMNANVFKTKPARSAPRRRPGKTSSRAECEVACRALGCRFQTNAASTCSRRVFEYDGVRMSFLLHQCPLTPPSAPLQQRLGHALADCQHGDVGERGSEWRAGGIYARGRR
jgi:hypothetical protein